VSKTFPGSLSEGTAAFPWPRPRRGEFDQLVWDGLVYSCEDGYRPLFLDLHVPRAGPGERLPVVLWIHGGGWAAGSRRRMSPIG
jgi:acetyl esterase/lipase